MKSTTKRLGALLVLATLVGFVIAGCSFGTTTAATTGSTAAVVEVKVGVIAPFSGPRPKTGLDALNAVQMAIDDFNSSQSKIRATSVVGDDAADPAKASAVAERFAADSAIVGVIGPMNSSAVQAALPALDKAMLAMITQSATDDGLNRRGYQVFHRICPVDAAQSGAVAGIIAGYLKAKKVSILADRSAYGQGIAEQVQKILKETYRLTDIQRLQVSGEDSDFSAVVREVKSYKPDVFFAATPSPAVYATVAQQMTAQNYRVQLVGTDTVKDKGEFIDNAGGATEGALFTSLGPLLETSNDPRAQEFVKKYTSEYQVLSMFSGPSYEAMNVLLDAIARDLYADGRVTREGVLEALKTTDYIGLLGVPISFKENGDMKASGVFVGQVKDGRFVQIKAADY